MNRDSSTLERLNRIAQCNRISLEIPDSIDSTDTIEIIRDRLNATFFATADKWMLPNWAIRHIWHKGKRSDVEESISNNRYRNWIVIGGPGSKSYAISDHTGLVTAIEDCGSLDFWPKVDEVEFPALEEYGSPRLNLVSVDDQMYEWKTASGPLEFTRLLYHVIEDDTEYIFNEIILRNLSLEPQETSFFVALRPLSIRGVEPIESLTYDSIRRMLFSNNRLALISEKPPSSVIMDTFDNPNLLATLDESTERMDLSYSAARGNGTAILKYDINLRPAGQERMVFASPLFKASESDKLGTISMSPRVRDDAVARWFDFNEDAPKGSYPNEDLMMATAQGKTSLVIQAREYVRKMDPETIVSKGYDLVRIQIALSRSGCANIAKTLASEIVQGLGSLELTNDMLGSISSLVWSFVETELICSGYPLSDEVNSFIDSAGSLIEDFIREIISHKHAEVVSVPEPVADPYPDISKMVGPDSFETDQTDSTDSTSEPENLENVYDDSQENKPANEYEPENLQKQTLQDVQDAIWILAAADTFSTKREGIPSLLEEFRQTVEEICESVLKEHPWSIDSVDDTTVIMDLIGTFSLLKGKYVKRDLIEMLYTEVIENLSFRGLIRYPTPSSRVSSHLRLRLANAAMLLDDRDEVERALDKLTDYLSEYYTLPEWIDIDTKGGTNGDGCSIIASADLRLLLRDILVYEKDGNLYVFPGLPEPWFTSTSSIVASDIPSEIGKVSLETGVSANQHQIEIELEKLPEEIEVFLPFHIPLHMVKVFGGSTVARFDEPSKRIRLVPLSERVTLTFHR
ncbi:MAG: hypothetical protein ACFFF4_06710 [Candidatus Thorarchaeota archaeon]